MAVVVAGDLNVAGLLVSGVFGFLADPSPFIEGVVGVAGARGVNLWRWAFGPEGADVAC